LEKILTNTGETGRLRDEDMKKEGNYVCKERKGDIHRV
jgi:hypothetical protein